MTGLFVILTLLGALRRTHNCSSYNIIANSLSFNSLILILEKTIKNATYLCQLFFLFHSDVQDQNKFHRGLRQPIVYIGFYYYRSKYSDYQVFSIAKPTGKRFVLRMREAIWNKSHSSLYCFSDMLRRLRLNREHHSI